MPEVSDYGANKIQSEKEPVQFMGVEPAGSIAAGAEYTFTYEPDYDANVVGLRAPAALAPFFAVTGMKIGPVSVMAGSGPFPLDAFTSDSTLRLALALPVTQKAPLKLTVRNMDTAAHAGLYVGVVAKVKRAQ